jgi:hypothetical protein
MEQHEMIVRPQHLAEPQPVEGTLGRKLGSLKIEVLDLFL